MQTDRSERILALLLLQQMKGGTMKGKVERTDRKCVDIVHSDLRAPLVSVEASLTIAIP